jgi:hypothetical protein
MCDCLLYRHVLKETCGIATPAGFVEGYVVRLHRKHVFSRVVQNKIIHNKHAIEFKKYMFF